MKLLLAGIFSFLFINLAQAQVPLYGTITGGNTINVTVPGNYGGTYYTGHSFIFLAVGSVTSGPVSISVNGAATRPLKKNVSQDLVSGDIVHGQAVPVIYDGTNFQVINAGSVASASTGAGTGNLHAFRARSSSNSPANNLSTVTYDVLDFDLSGEFNTTNSSFIPNEAGYYYLNAAVGVNFASGINEMQAILKHSTSGDVEIRSLAGSTYLGNGTGTGGSEVSGVFYANAGDKFNVYINSGNGTFQPLNVAASRTHFSGFKINGGGTLTVSSFIGGTSTSGISTLNGLTTTSQNFSTSSTGTSVNITSSGSTHNFNIPLVTVVGGNNVTVSGGFPNYTISGLAGGTSTSQWVSTTGGIYYSGGNIGLKINPQYDLHLYNPTAGVYSRFETPITTTTFNVLEFKTGIYNSTTLRSNAIWQLGMYQAGTASDPNDKMYFGRSGLSSTDLAVYRDGNVGIGLPGASVPSEKLTVLGNISASGIGYFSTIAGLALNGAAVGSIVTVDGIGRLGFGTLPSSNNSQWVSTTSGIYYNGGRVGIGTANPLALNHIYSPSAVDPARLLISGQNANLAFGDLFNTDPLVTPTWHIDNLSGGLRVYSQPNLTTNGVLISMGINTNGDIQFGRLATGGPTLGLGVNNIGQLVTISGASDAITSLNTLTTSSQTFSTSSTGSSININSSGSNHNFNIPVVTVVGGTNVTVSGGFPTYTITGKPNTPSNWTDSGIQTYHNTGGNVGVNASGTLNARFVVGGNNASNQTSGAEEVVQIGSNESGSPLLRLGVWMQVANLPQNRYMALNSTNSLLLQSNSGNVGIGSALPNEKLTVQGNTSVTGIGYFGSLQVKNLVGPGTVTVDGLGNLGVSTGSSNLTNFWTITGSTLSPAIASNRINISTATGGYQINGNDVVTFETNTAAGNSIYLGGAGKMGSSGGNVAIGNLSGINNTGTNNVFIGLRAGNANTSGNYNSFVGAFSGYNLQNTNFNSFFGYGAGVASNTGADNTFIGGYAGQTNTSGSGNIALGVQADFTSNNLFQAIAIGYRATVGGSNMMALGGQGAFAVNVGIGTGLPQNTIDVVGGARIRNLSVSGAVFANATGDLYISTLAGGASNLWTVSGFNLQPTTTYGVNLTSTTTSYMIGGVDVVRYMPRGGGVGNNILLGGAGNQSMTGDGNVLIGDLAGVSNTSGSYNSFVGYGAGMSNTNGAQNTFIGRTAGRNNTSGGSNTFIGNFAGWSNVSGSSNTYNGWSAGTNNLGSGNSYFGFYSGINSTAGSDNSIFGYFADIPGSSVRSVAIGAYATVLGSNMMALGGVAGSPYAVSVGIGTGLPQNTIDVVGGARIRNLSVSGAVFANASGDLYISSTAGLSGSGTANGVAFWRNGTTLTADGANFTYIPSNKSLKVGNAILSSNSSSGNVFFGNNVGNQTMSGTDNNFFGTNIGQIVTSGKNNNFFGKGAGSNNVLGESNNYLGEDAGSLNQIGSYNNAMGYQAGYGNVSGIGSNNNSFGQGTGFENEGDGNNFMGFFAGRANTSGNYNNFFGQSAGLVNTTGSDNIFIGQESGLNNSTGDNNIAIGKYAGFPTNGSNNSVAIGYNATVGGSNIMALGGSGIDAVRVGIGTGIPQNTIDVVGGARIRNLSISGAVFANASGDLYINTITATNLWTVSGTSLIPSTPSYGLNIGTTSGSGLVNISSTATSGLVVSSTNLPTNTGAIMAYSSSASSAGIGAFVYGTSSTGLYGEATNALSTGVTANNSGGGTALRVTANGSSAPVAQINNNGATGTALNINLLQGVNTATGLLISSPSPTSQAMDITGKVQLRNYANGTLTVDGFGNLGVSTSTGSVGAGAGFMATSILPQINIPSGAWTTAAFDIEAFDDLSTYNNSLFEYTAPSTGVYQVNANVPFANIGQVDIAIAVNLVNSIVNSASTSPTTGVVTSVPISGIIKLTANQKVTIRIRQFTGNLIATSSSSTGANASFSMVKLY